MWLITSETIATPACLLCEVDCHTRLPAVRGGLLKGPVTRKMSGCSLNKFDSSRESFAMPASKCSSVVLAAVVLCSLIPQSAWAQTNTLQRYVTDDFVAGFVAQPTRLLKSKHITGLIEATGQSDEFDKRMVELKEGMGLDPREVDQIIMLLDKHTIYQLAGLPDEAVDEPVGAEQQQKSIRATQQRNNLKQIALGFHNFHDVYNGFVDDDGRDDNKGNLSWRVHLLPYLGQAPLYNQFHLDEPWNSDHNKTLIAEMPDVFLTNGVKEKGKTAVHVLNSETALFGGDKGPRMRDITDGTSNTILTVVAGSDKADFWTKPGGLELKDGVASETLGKIGATFHTGLADGSVRELPAELEARVFQALATKQGGEIVRDLDDEVELAAARRLPSWIVRSTTDIDQEAIFKSLQPMGKPVDIQVPGGTLKTFGEYALSFPDSKTLIAAPANLLPKMLQAKAIADTPLTQRFQAAGDKNDFLFAADLIPLTALKNELAGNLPMAGIVQTINAIQASFDVSGSSEYLQNVTAEMQNEASAAQLSALLMGLMQMQKAQMMGMANSPDSPIDGEMLKTLTDLFDRTVVKPEGVNVLYGVPKPDDMAAFVETLKPVVIELFSTVTQARGAAQRMTRKNHLKQIGLAFHNYHDVYGAFPRHGGDADEQSKGLSWRVQLLPFVEELALYQRFKRDEPWDSEHNKKLIAEMPDVFKTEGVNKRGHTSLHVFTGEKTPFGDGSQKTRIRDFLDGTSNTFLVVDAGASKADIWTKPGGLEFTGKDGVKILGNIADTFHALMTDGSVRSVSATIDEGLLNNLIQHQDGNAVGDL